MQQLAAAEAEKADAYAQLRRSAADAEEREAFHKKQMAKMQEGIDLANNWAIDAQRALKALQDERGQD